MWGATLRTIHISLSHTTQEAGICVVVVRYSQATHSVFKLENDETNGTELCIYIMKHWARSGTIWTADNGEPQTIRNDTAPLGFAELSEQNPHTKTTPHP